MSKTVWLLDVDGVINSNRPGWGGPPHARMVYPQGRPFRIRWEPELVERIWRLHNSGRVLIWWATSWADHIDWIERSLGLPSFPLAHPVYGSGLSDVRSSKLEAARGVLECGWRLVWTDDDAIPGDFALKDPRSLLIRPRPNRGLRPEDLVRIESFVGLDPEIAP
jgi:hypothetical protein